MARDCEEPRSNANMTCHNCNKGKTSVLPTRNLYHTDFSVGHMSRDCPEPRDYSKVTCRQCGNSKLCKVDIHSSKMLIWLSTAGHTVKRCPELKEDTEGNEQVKDDNAQTTERDTGAAADWDAGPTTDSAGLNW